MSRPREDLTNLKFGLLTVVSSTKEKYQRSPYWLCKCKCGNDYKVIARSLKSGNTKSCGCLNKPKPKTKKEKQFKHGAAKSVNHKGNKRLDYVIWCGIRQRCYDEKCRAYKNYGGRGIKLCKEWYDDFNRFADYIRTLPNCPNEAILMSRLKGKRSPVSLDRIKNYKNYKPGNLKWSTSKEQNNNRRSNCLVRYKGQNFTLAQAVEKYAVVGYKTVRDRINRYNWSVEEALTTPSNRNKKFDSI